MVHDSRVLALECTQTMTPSCQSTSSNQADIPNSNYSTRPTDPDQNTYSQKQWASLFAHKGNPLWTLFIPLSPSPPLLLRSILLLILTQSLEEFSVIACSHINVMVMTTGQGRQKTKENISQSQLMNNFSQMLNLNILLLSP